MLADWFANTDPNIMMWLGFVVFFLVVELISVGLTSIWFAAGAFCALLVAAFTPGGLALQAVVFFAVSAALLAATRPFASRFINSRTQTTNVEDLVGEEIVIKERVSNSAQTGCAVVRGQEWTVRADRDTDVLEAGDHAVVVGISGVKLMVKPLEEAEGSSTQM